MIKEFKTIIEAFNYCKACPICKERILFDSCNFIYNSNGYKISFSDREYIIAINQDNHVDIEYRASHSDVYDILGNVFFCNNVSNQNINIINGMLIFGHQNYCNSCDCYGYTMQIHIDTNKLILDKVVLNSEFITIIDKKDAHEIRNVYTTEKTEYKLIGNRKEYEKITFPLISKDFSNPKDVLQRIKKLLPFS